MTCASFVSTHSADGRTVNRGGEWRFNGRARLEGSSSSRNTQLCGGAEPTFQKKIQPTLDRFDPLRRKSVSPTRVAHRAEECAQLSADSCCRRATKLVQRPIERGERFEPRVSAIIDSLRNPEDDEPEPILPCQPRAVCAPDHIGLLELDLEVGAFC